MSYPRNMAGAVALLASSSLLGLGCMVATDEQGNDADDQAIVADDVNKLDEQASCECAVTDDDTTEAATEATGESKDALWGGGYGRGFGGYGRGFGGYGRGFGGYGRGFGGYGFGGYGRGFGGYGLGYGRGFGGYGLGYGLGYGYGGYGYPFYGYGGYGYPFYGYGGYGCGC